jgi:hypothetical protein
MHHVTRREVPLIISVCALILVGALIICYVIFNTFSSYLQGKKPSLEFPNQHLKVHKVIENLSSPTSMAFIDNNDMLVLERSGSVRLISDGILHDQPVLTVPVDTDGERGLLGIATASDSTLGNYQAKDTIRRSAFNPREQKSDYVFLYFTEAKEGEPLRNRIYGYEWNGQDLINPVL